MCNQLIALILLFLSVSPQRGVFFGQNVSTAPPGSLGVDSQMPSQTATIVTGSNTSPFTTSFTNTSGTVLYLALWLSDVAVTSVGCTYNGIAMTTLGHVGADSGAADALYLFRLNTPAVGSNVFSCSWGTVPTVNTITAAAISFHGSNPTPDSGIATTANDGSDFSHTAFPLTLTSTTSGNIGIEAVCFGDPSYSSVSDTLSANTAGHPDGSGPCGNFALQYGTISGTSKTLTVNGTTPTSWATIGVEVRH